MRLRISINNTTRSQARRRTPLAALGAAGLLALGCQPETRIVSARGALRGLPGAETRLDVPPQGLPPARPPGELGAAPPAGEAGEPLDPDKASQDPLRVVEEDGSVRLICSAPRHLVWHLQQTIINAEYDLIYEQLLSDKIIERYRARGLDPRESLAFFRKRGDDVLELLARMPRGELTPGVFIRRVGEGVHRLQPIGRSAGGDLGRIDFAWEGGSCRLVLIH